MRNTSKSAAAKPLLDDLKKQITEFQRQEVSIATPEKNAKVLALARDLQVCGMRPPRNRMMRLLIKDITVDKQAKEPHILFWYSSTRRMMPDALGEDIRTYQPIVRSDALVRITDTEGDLGLTEKNADHRGVRGDQLAA